MQFAKAVQTLCDGRVEFVIIGGVAAYAHGYGQATLDLDICYSQSKPNLGRLAAALAPFHPRLRDLPPDLPFVWDEVTLQNGSVFTLSSDLGSIDVMAEVPGVGDYESVRNNSIEVTAFGRQVRILSLQSLIASKRASGRPKDLDALPALESLAEAAGSE
jgi:hypothetical protein